MTIWLGVTKKGGRLSATALFVGVLLLLRVFDSGVPDVELATQWHRIQVYVEAPVFIDESRSDFHPVVLLATGLDGVHVFSVVRHCCLLSMVFAFREATQKATSRRAGSGES